MYACNRKRDSPSVPLILEGAISDKKIGPTQSPIPEPMPTRNLQRLSQWDGKKIGNSCLPSPKVFTPPLVPISAVPTVTRIALVRAAAFLPYRSMTMLAERLPSKPPRVKIAVTTENVKSDIGIHFGRLNVVSVVCSFGWCLHVSTDWIWLRTEM